MLKIFRINQTDFEHWTGVTTGEARLGWRVIYVTSIERLPICIMKCYKSVQNVQPSGNIEMMYSEPAIPAQSALPHHITACYRLGLIWKKQTLFVFISFSPLISKLMVDSLMGANTQMYYLNGRIDYTGIVTQPRHSDGLSPVLLLLLSPLS